MDKKVITGVVGNILANGVAVPTLLAMLRVPGPAIVLVAAVSLVVVTLWGHTPDLGWRRRLLPAALMICGVVLFGWGSAWFYLKDRSTQNTLPLEVFIGEQTRIKAKSIAFPDKESLGDEFEKTLRQGEFGIRTMLTAGGKVVINIIIANISRGTIKEARVSITSNINFVPRTNGLGLFSDNQSQGTFNIIPLSKTGAENFFSLEIEVPKGEFPVCFLVLVERDENEPYAAIGCTKVLNPGFDAKPGEFHG